jgi:hypothetical protein
LVRKTTPSVGEGNDEVAVELTALHRDATVERILRNEGLSRPNLDSGYRASLMRYHIPGISNH